jgi:dTDP-4-amino-4,6-dideoxygalactose transaminase
MLLCKEEEDAKHALKLATQAREDCPYYLHTEIGFNYRMSNISAGIGCGQLKVLQKRIEKKRAIYKAYQSALSSLPLTFQPLREEAPSNCWLTSMTIDEHSGVTPTDVINALGEKDIEARHFWNPMHRQPIFAKEAFVSLSDKSIATSLFTRGVCLPSDTKMTDEDVDCVCNAIKTLF